jgi:AcrR family transcriptional regulator
MIHFLWMAYRPTERTEARKAATKEAIFDAARELIAHGGYAEARVAAVAERAGVATGTVYRHYGSKAELFAAVFRRVSQGEVDALVAAADAGSDRPAAERIADAFETFARRAMRAPRLAYALLAEPVDPLIEAERLAFRRAYRDGAARVIDEGVASGELPPQDAGFTAAALVGAAGESLVGPLSPTTSRRNPDQLVSWLRDFCIRSVTGKEPANVGS